MRKILALCLPLLVVGCQGGDTPPSTTTPSAPTVAALGRPATAKSSAVALVNGGDEVTVGMTAKNAFKVFPPPNDGDLGQEQLPPVFQPPYAAKTWETTGRGFGVITYEEYVAAAIYEVDQASDEMVDRFTDVQQSICGLGPEGSHGRAS